MLDGESASSTESKTSAIGPADKFRNATTDEWPLWGGILGGVVVAGGIAAMVSTMLEQQGGVATM
eukprot:CAMPEP_0173427958 /NCGR_PEP_ID=MMETSP1357-20121228/7034_1 /TAXON_ID=77926 /ORGANISM="Hemiselmis rufescens, Strain PCC563" /LENGTH=64 /DNA_ID=CAMNT_0014391897 /DNA_START=99 /DNA_END=293 /DNA_ORIENTATION=-